MAYVFFLQNLLFWTLKTTGNEIVCGFHGQFSVDWKVEFGDQDSIIVIVKLLAQAGQTFPRPMLLDENSTL